MKSRKEIADYISINKVDRARIRVEHIIREDNYVEAMEMYGEINKFNLKTNLSVKCFSSFLGSNCFATCCWLDSDWSRKWSMKYFFFIHHLYDLYWDRFSICTDKSIRASTKHCRLSFGLRREFPTTFKSFIPYIYIFFKFLILFQQRKKNFIYSTLRLAKYWRTSMVDHTQTQPK